MSETNTETKENETNTTETAEKKETEVQTVSKEDHDRALKDLHKFKARAKELEDAVKATHTKSMKEKEQWKELAELREKEAEDLKKEKTKIQESLIYDKKYSAVKEAALAAGIRKEAVTDLELLEFSEVQIETTSTGRINILGADKAVDRLKTLKPHWFGSKGAKINGDIPDVQTGGKITKTQVYEAESKAKKTGDYAPYKQILAKYSQQAKNN
jgi:hypothetical protein